MKVRTTLARLVAVAVLAAAGAGASAGIASAEVPQCEQLRQQHLDAIARLVAIDHLRGALQGMLIDSDMVNNEMDYYSKMVDSYGKAANDLAHCV